MARCVEGVFAAGYHTKQRRARQTLNGGHRPGDVGLPSCSPVGDDDAAVLQLQLHLAVSCALSSKLGA